MIWKPKEESVRRRRLVATMLNVTKRARETGHWMSQCGDFEYFGKDSCNVLEGRSLTQMMEKKIGWEN